ncbi:MAG: type II toxin-antitoxin system RelE/ParE family toxin [Limisphaerales bacterium]
MVFEEFAPFTKRVMYLLNNDELADEQRLLLARPDAGKVIPRSGGLRKLRVAAKGHGKRGGARIIHYWVVARDRILLLDIYAKNEKEDLSAFELKLLRTLIEDYQT